MISTCKAANFHLYNISRVRKYPNRDACEKLVHAFVTSKLDYGNALLYGLPEYLMNKLQKIQNTAARLVCELPKFCHISSVLKDLHWLPVRSRISFKILLLTYKAVNGFAPEYISELLTPYVPSRTLRSSSKLLLQEPRTNFATGGDRAFEKVAPKLWNTLPMDIRCATLVGIFKCKLKTYLFTN